MGAGCGQQYMRLPIYFDILIPKLKLFSIWFSVVPTKEQYSNYFLEGKFILISVVVVVVVVVRWIWYLWSNKHW